MEIMLKAVVHNTSPVAGDVEIKLTLDDHLELQAGGSTASKTLTLAAGQSKSTLFPVKFVQTGTATLKWTATGAGAAKELTDSVQSTLEIGTTEPLLRDLRFLNVGENAAGKNLLANNESGTTGWARHDSLGDVQQPPRGRRGGD